MEEITEEKLQELRELYKQESDPAKRQEIAKEGQKVKAYLAKPKWGSVEVGGCGWCYECHSELARPSHYNCLKCSGEKKVVSHVENVAEAQQRLLEWSKTPPKKYNEHQMNVEDAFQIKFEEP